MGRESAQLCCRTAQESVELIVSFESQVNVVNHHGWHKSFVLQKNIVHIGSDERNDIVLHDTMLHDTMLHDAMLNDGVGSAGSGAGGVMGAGIGSTATRASIAPRHAQLLPSPINRQGFRLINLSDQVIEIWPSRLPPGSDPIPLGPRDTAEIVGGDCAQIGSYKLQFQGGEQQSNLLAIRTSLQSTKLSQEEPITGSITVYHRGNEAGVQLKIEVDGIDATNIELDPGPVLFPDTEKEVPFTIYHSGMAYPPAGEHQLHFHVTAPEVYPDERASTTAIIDVEPLYQHTLRMLPRAG